MSPFFYTGLAYFPGISAAQTISYNTQFHPPLSLFFASFLLQGYPYIIFNPLK